MARPTPEKLGRREAMGLFVGFAAAACTGGRGAAGPRDALEGRVELWSWFDLPPGPNTEEISGITWDDRGGVLWGVQDNTPQVVELRPDATLRTWSVGPAITVKVAGPLDLEGIAILHGPEGGFVVCSEIGPRILELDRDGVLRRELVVPDHFKEARVNKSLESIATSRSGRYLFTTSEIALARDGAAATTVEGTRLRILRFDQVTDEIREHAYLTDSASQDGADYGVADIASIADDEILLLERGWARALGNSARIYRAKLEDRAICSGAEPLTGPRYFMEKKLVVDLGKLECRGLPASKQPQANAILDNYEGLTLGPRLPDGRRSLIVASDDNARTDQFARILVLAIG